MASVKEESTSNESNSQQSQTSAEIDHIRAAFPSRCRVTCDVGQYQKVITLQPENIDATIKFQLTAAYPSVIPDIKVRSESLTDNDIQKLQEHLMTKAKELIGQEMIKALMQEASDGLKSLGIRPGKVKNVNAETFINEKSKKKKNKSKQKSNLTKQLEDEVENKKLPPMKTAEDVVNRIIWDDNLESDMFLVGYIDRFRGLLEKYFSAFSWEDIATVDYDVLAIPKHRIQYFKYKDVKVWDKTKRIDNVFGSANGTKTIDVVIKEVEEKETKQREINKANAAMAAAKSSSDEDSDEYSSDDSDDDFITVTISKSVNIGMPKEDEGNSAGNNPYWTDKLRPNYFLCIRITDQEVINGIMNIQDDLLRREPILAECCIPGASLHITICTLGLDTSEQLLLCMEALKKMKSELKSMLPKSLLKFKGVSNFYSRVVYAKVQFEKDFLEFCDSLKLNLNEAGVQIRDGYEFVPHVTVIKITRPVSRIRGTKNIDPKYYEKHSDAEIGEQGFDKIYLCSMGDERRADGFYLTPLELDLTD